MPTTKGLTIGDVTELRCFFHVRPGHEEQMREVCTKFVSAKGLGDSWVIQTGVHDATFTLFDDDRRFLFATCYDTDWDPYIEDAVRLVGADKWYAVLQHCEEVPEGRNDNPPNAEEIKVILEANRVTSQYYVRAYPDGTIAEILKALRVQKAFQTALDHPDAAEALAHPALKPLLEEAAD